MTYRLSIQSPPLDGSEIGVEPLPDGVIVRRDTAADAARIRVIARLDDQRPQSGPFLVAEMTGEIVAAFALSSGIVVADPFRPTADAVALLRLRAAQLAAERNVVRLRRRVRAARPAAA